MARPGARPKKPQASSRRPTETARATTYADAASVGAATEPTGPSVPIMVLAGLALAAIVLAVHWQTLTVKSDMFDDALYLRDNQLVRSPSWASAGRFLGEVWTPSTVGGYYQPLAMISLMLDCALGGNTEHLSPFRVTSLVLHLANTVLLAVLLYQLFRSWWPAVLVALLYGLHPTSVESVAWLAQRKTVLATFFALLSLLLYVRYARTGRWKTYVAVSTLFLLAVLAKPTVTPLPILFLLLDYWPLNRLNKAAVVEKIPLLILSAIFMIITYVSQAATAGLSRPEGNPLVRAVLLLGYNIIFYLYHTIWPIHLSPHYPMPRPLTLDAAMIAALVGTATLLALLAVSWKWTRSLITGWLFFFVAMFPAMGVIGFSRTIAADRFLYLPMIGFLLPLTWLLVKLWSAGRQRRTGAIAAVAILALGETFLTRAYLDRWQTSDQLAELMLARTPHSGYLNSYLAGSLTDLKRQAEALPYFEKAIAVTTGGGTDAAELHYNLGNALRDLGRVDEAIEHYRKAVGYNTQYQMAYINLGVSLNSKSRYEEAAAAFRSALAIKLAYDPFRQKAHNGLGVALFRLGRYDEAVREYEQALKLDPRYENALMNLCNVLLKQRKYDQAVARYRQALAIDPDQPLARKRLAELTASRPNQ